MITVSPEFNTAQFADVAQFAAQINLVLGNYAASAAGATIVASGSDASGNYPASGAIDSDRTEINIGAPSAADNGAGKSSWKANTAPSPSVPNTLTITFNAPTNGGARTFNRVKLFNLAADPLTSYLLQYWNGSAWVSFAGTPDQFPTGGSGNPFGGGGFGGGPFDGGSGGGYTGGLDQYDFSTVTATKIQLLIYATTSGNAAQVVEIEVYRTVDITSRTMDYKIDRKKDMKLANPIATQTDITVDNSDQFFSFSYAPTPAQVTAGFVNSELGALGWDIEINEGFYTPLGIEMIRTFTGSADSLTVNAKPGTAMLSGRDYMKHLINQIDSCNLKTNVDITTCIQYLLNRNNVSNYQMNLFTTTIILAYFFDFETAPLTTIQELVQAAGDSIFYFDEKGIAQFQYYLSNTPQSNNVSTQSGWNAGTLWGLDSSTNPGAISNLLTIVSGTYQTLYTAGGIGLYNRGGLIIGGSGSVASEARIASGQAYGYWAIGMRAGGSSFGTITDIIFDSVSGNYYSLRLTTTQIILYKNTTPLLTVGGSFFDQNLVVTRSGSGVFTVFNNGVSIGTATDNTLTVCTHIRLRADQFASSQWYNASVSPNVSGTNGVDFLAPVWQSPSIDRTTAISSAGTVTIVAGMQTGTATYRIFTSSSPDNSTWSAWVEVGAGGADLSPATRYVRYLLVMTSYFQGGSFPNQETIFNSTITWSTGAGQQKWSPSVNFFFAYNNTITDLQQQVSDNLGGDTAVVNDVAVTSSPLVLGGNSTDTVWQGTAGSPPASISASNPLSVAVGTLVFNISIAGGMDTSQMGGVNTGSGGGAIALTFASGATGSAQVTYTHPTKPTLTVTITHAGTITDLRLIGQTFQNITTPYQSLASDPNSIGKYRRRHLDINNDYIVNGSIGGIIATKTISNFKSPTTWLPKLSIIPKLNMQPGDQVNVTELVSGLAANYYVIGFQRMVRLSRESAEATMDLALLQVPTS